MTYDELLAEVYTLTNRPDLTAETASAVKAATLKAHHSDYYSKDIYETTLDLGDASYIFSIDLHSIISNFRTMKYMRKVDSTGEVTKFLDMITPEEVLDRYANTRTDVAYMAGRVLEVRSSTEFNKLLIGCYVHPLITKAEWNSWVAIYHPYAIIYEAARVVFKAIGYDEQSATFDRLVGEQYQLLRTSALTDLGF